MKTRYLIIFLGMIFGMEVAAQSTITIESGASMTVEAGADICSDDIEINGSISGGGTRCTSLPLPVELVSFDGFNTEDGVVLNWETATETNNYGFNVELRIENGEWETKGFVEGYGTTNSPKNYEFTDSELPNVESVDYRLKQIDNDGTISYSKTITVDLTTITDVDDEVVYEFALEQNYPNPFNPSTTISFTVPSVIASGAKQSVNTILKVYDILGREVATLVNQKLQLGNHEVEFDASSLSSGMYFYRIDVGSEFTSIRKMLMIK